MPKENILELENLSIHFHTPAGEVEAVRNVSLTAGRGEILCLVGESGCGKTVMCQSILKLLPGNSRYKSGRIILDGTDITSYSEKEMRNIRGVKASMIFQDPMTTLNPTIPVGKQIEEAFINRNKISREKAKEKAIELMKLVGIDHAQEMYHLQPHFFSGGMRQRCVIAIAIALEPKLLIADEALTALDVTVGSKILDLLLEIRDKIGISIIFVTHDLGAVARVADRVAVMYAGKIVEIGTVEEIFYDPKHPYTWGLLSSNPALVTDGKALYSIPGAPPILINPPKGDAFAVRNDYALAIDYEEEPPLFQISDTHFASTWLLDPRAPKIDPPEYIRSLKKKHEERQKAHGSETEQ